MCDWGHRAEALECQYAAIHWCERNKKVVGVHTHTHTHTYTYIYIQHTFLLLPGLAALQTYI